MSSGDSQRHSSSDRQARPDRRDGISPLTAARNAKAQLAELTGHQPESVSAFERTDDGYRLQVELVELERVPPTTSVLATYDVELDPSGDLRDYRRVRRYYRNATDER